jgi:hypothetical protein
VGQHRIVARRQPQVLAAASPGIETPAAQAVSEVDGTGKVAPHCSGVQDLHGLNPPPHRGLFQPTPNSLNFRQLGHWTRPD